MILYALKCSRDHSFDSWFQSAEAFDKLAASGHLGCVICGDASVSKVLMAPAVRPARAAVTDAARPVPPQRSQSLALPNTELEKAIAELRRKVEETSDYVGANFAQEARAIHDGGAPERSIWGEARPEEARALIEDGVPVAPLPFLPSRKAN